MDPIFELGRQVLQAQPFSVLIGARLNAFASDGSVELEVPITDALKQQYGFVHGGVLGYAADNALTYAGAAALGSAVVSSEYKINFLRPVLGEKLLARASVVHAGRSQAFCRCDLYVVAEGRELLCAAATGTITRQRDPAASEH